MLSDALAWSGEIYGVMSYKHSGGITLLAGSQHLIVINETFQIHSIARRIAKPKLEGSALCTRGGAVRGEEGVWAPPGAWVHSHPDVLIQRSRQGLL